MMKDEWRMLKDDGWMMKDDDFKLLRGFDDQQTNQWTDICECRIAFATEKRGPRSPYNCNNIITKLRKNKIWTVHREQYHPLAIFNPSLSVYHGD